MPGLKRAPQAKGKKRKDPKDSDSEDVKEYVLHSSWTIEIMLT